jgi:hypothetical protein
MSPHLRTRLTAAAIALALAGAAGCGDEDTEPDVANPPASVETAPADAADQEPAPGEATPGEATPAEADPGPAEQAAEDVIERADGEDQALADSVREAARRFDSEVEGAGGTSEEGAARARDGIERAIQDADPRTRESLEELLGEIDKNLTTQGGAG